MIAHASTPTKKKKFYCFALFPFRFSWHIFMQLRSDYIINSICCIPPFF